MKKFKYDTEMHDLRQLLLDLWEVGNLEYLHKLGEYPKFTMDSNSETEFHKKFYSKLRGGWPEFMDTYLNIVSVALGANKTDYVYQATPTLRVHLVGNWATPEFHKDSQEGYNHPSGETNWLIPLTYCYGNNSLWVESSPNRKDFNPIKMRYGDLINWDGNNLLHGNKINDTEITRVSFDFRTMHKRNYNPDYKVSSGTRGLQFKVGSYYSEF